MSATCAAVLYQILHALELDSPGTYGWVSESFLH